jgi:hypothetical protein
LRPFPATGAGWGLALRAGAELASDDTNAKGGLEVAGKKYKISVIPYDDKYQGQAAADAANRLIFMDKVKFIIGPMGSAAGLAAQEFLAAPGARSSETGWGLWLSRKSRRASAVNGRTSCPRSRRNSKRTRPG